MEVAEGGNPTADLPGEPIAFGIVLMLEARLRKAGLTAEQEIQMMRAIGEAFLARSAAPHCPDCNRVSDTLGRDDQPFCEHCRKYIGR